MPRAAVTAKAPIDRSAAFEVKRMDILRRCAQVFAEDGYHQTSVNSLAARLDVSKPVLYYYAKNKDDILLQCAHVAQQALQQAIDEATRAQVTGLEKIRRFFSTYADIMCGEFGRCIALLDRKVLSPAARKRDAAARRELEEAVHAMIREGHADHSIAGCDPILASRALFGAFNGIPRWYHADGKLKPKDVADGYMDLFISGIGRD